MSALLLGEVLEDRAWMLFILAPFGECLMWTRPLAFHLCTTLNEKKIPHSDPAFTLFKVRKIDLNLIERTKTYHI